MAETNSDRRHRHTRVQRVRADELARLRALYGMLEAYEKGLETARELDEQLAALVVQMGPHAGREPAASQCVPTSARAVSAAARQREAELALEDWLQHREPARLRQFLQGCAPAGRQRDDDTPGSAAA